MVKTTRKLLSRLRKAAIGFGTPKGQAFLTVFHETCTLVNNDELWRTAPIRTACHLIQLLATRVEYLQPANLPVDAHLTDAERLARFEAWLALSGVQLGSHGLTLAPAEGAGTGVFATRDIAADEVLFTIPSDVCMSSTSCAASILGDLAQDDPILQRQPSIALALHVLVEAGQANAATDCAASTLNILAGGDPLAGLTAGTPWRPYLAVLPWTGTSQLWWAARDLQGLAACGHVGHALALHAARTLRNTAKLYTVLYQKYVLDSSSSAVGAAAGLTPSSFTWAAFKWAVATVMARQNAVPLHLLQGEAHDGPDGTAVTLVPGWDMLNHEAMPTRAMTTAFNVVARAGHPDFEATKPLWQPSLSEGELCAAHVGVIQCSAARSFASGEQVTMYYGNRNNDDMLLYAGFVEPGATVDVVALPVWMPGQQDPLAKLRPLLLRNAGCGEPDIADSVWHAALSISVDALQEMGLGGCETLAGSLAGRRFVSCETPVPCHIARAIHSVFATLPGVAAVTQWPRTCTPEAWLKTAQELVNAVQADSHVMDRLLHTVAWSGIALAAARVATVDAAGATALLRAGKELGHVPATSQAHAEAASAWLRACLYRAVVGPDQACMFEYSDGAEVCVCVVSMANGTLHLADCRLLLATCLCACTRARASTGQSLLITRDWRFTYARLTSCRR